jgi:DNA-binding MarR family transcriptional regulator
LASERTDRELALRIGRAWVQMRRGASMVTIRDFLFGSGDDALEQGQMDTLDLLATRPAWRMTELADALRVDRSTATRAVERLVKAGLASRGSSDDDGRVVQVRISSAGAARHRTVSARRGQLMTHMLDAYDAEERVLLAELLDRFVDAIDRFVATLDAEATQASTTSSR